MSCQKDDTVLIIKYNQKCLECAEDCTNNQINNIDIYVNPQTSPLQLAGILTRAIIGALVASSSSMQDLLYSACYLSASLAEEIQNFKAEKFGIKVHIQKEIVN